MSRAAIKMDTAIDFRSQVKISYRRHVHAAHKMQAQNFVDSSFNSLFRDKLNQAEKLTVHIAYLARIL